MRSKLDVFLGGADGTALFCVVSTCFYILNNYKVGQPNDM